MGFNSLAIGRSALIAANYGLQVTGQNLANVNTDGYSRQRMSQSGTMYGSAGYGGSAALGSGVSIASVNRIASAQAEKQYRQATSQYTQYVALKECYTNMQTIFGVGDYFNEASRTAVSDLMTSFWNSLEDLSANVESISNRTATANKAQALATRFNEMDYQLREYRDEMNPAIEKSVEDINSYLREIADLNRAIVQAESGGVTGVCANDLRDQRGESLRKLSEILDVTVTEEKNGSVVVTLDGRSLVYHDQVSPLAINHEKRDGVSCSVPVFAKDGYPIKPSTGKLAAQMDIRDNIVPGYLEELNQLAGSFTWEFNRAYSQTRGSEPYQSLTSLNGPVDSAVTLDKLAFKGNVPEGTFRIVNGNLEIIVFNKVSGEEKTIPIEIDLDGRLGPGGEPDMILYDRENPDAPNSLINRMQKELDAYAPGAFKVEIDNDNKVSITALEDDFSFCFGKDTSGVLAALGMNVLFTGFGAGDIGVNQDVFDNPGHMGTSMSSEGGDNEGVKSMLKLRDAGNSRLKGMTGEEYFRAMAGRVGSEAQTTNTQYYVKVDLINRMFTQREQICGVNEDEETINLIAYQRAYQSAAKFISVVDGLYDTLLNM